MKSIYFSIGCLLAVLFFSCSRKGSIHDVFANTMQKPEQTAHGLHNTNAFQKPSAQLACNKKTMVIKVLITSFGGYSEYDPNPSQVLMAYVQSHYSRKNVKISFQIIDNSFRYCQEWVQRTDLGDYDIVIHTGVNGMIQTFELEQYAKNEFDEFRDVEDSISDDHRIFFNDSTVSYQTTIDIGLIIRYAQYPECIAISEDAGGYMCNLIYYLSCHKAIHDSSVGTDIIFIHIPPFERIGLEQQYPIFENLLDLLIQYEYFKLPSRK